MLLKQWFSEAENIFSFNSINIQLINLFTVTKFSLI